MRTWTRQDGFTLAELLVACAILGMVMAAVFGVLSVSMRAYTSATSLEDAQLGVRAGVERMATELRLIGADYSGAIGAAAPITAATSTSITFIGDVDGAETTVAAAATGATVNVSGTFGAAATNYLYVSNGAVREVRLIGSVSGTTVTLSDPLVNTYAAGSIVRGIETVTYALDAAANRLTRTVAGSAEEPLIDNVTALTFTYYDSAGIPTTTASAIREVQVSLTARGSDGSTRTLTTRVRLRN